MTIRSVVLTGMVVACALCSRTASAGERCSDATIAGRYGFSISGKNLGLGGIDFILLGQFTTDGAGTLTGKGTQNVEGEINRLPFTGEYHVNNDCSGVVTITFSSGIAANLDFVIVNGGKEVLLIASDPGTLETGTAKRIAARR